MPTKRSSASADLLMFAEGKKCSWQMGWRTPAGLRTRETRLGRRREGSLATIGAGIGLRYPLPGITDSGIIDIGPATGATFTGTLREEGT
jgi:hypothetical protein